MSVEIRFLITLPDLVKLVSPNPIFELVNAVDLHYDNIVLFQSYYCSNIGLMFGNSIDNCLNQSGCFL